MNINVGDFLPQTKANLNLTKKTSDTDINRANEKLVEIQESIGEDYTNQKKEETMFSISIPNFLKEATIKLEKDSKS